MSEIHLSQSSSPEQCPDPIRNEYVASHDPDLVTIIDEFADEGVEVNVILERTIADEGIVITNDMSDEAFEQALNNYAKFVIDTCGISEYDGLLLIRVREDRATHIEALNRQDDYKRDNASDFNDFVDDFHNNVRVADEGDMEQAAADALEEYYDEQFVINEPIIEQEEDTEPVPSVAQPPKDSIDIPVVPIVGVTLGVAALGAVVAGSVNVLRKQKSTKALITDFIGTIDADSKRFTAAFIQDKTGDDLKDNVGSAEAIWILGIPSSDAPKLAELRSAIADKRDSWLSMQSGFLDKLSKEPKGIKANPKRIESLKNAYAQESEAYMSLVNDIEFEVSEMLERRAKLDESFAELASKIAVLKNRYEQSDGGANIKVGDKSYSMTSFKDEFATLSNAYETAFNQFNIEHLLNQPFEIVADAVARAEELQLQLDTIQETQQRLVSRQANATEAVSATALSVSGASQLVAEITTKYHSNLLGSTDEELKTLAEMQKSITDALGTIADPAAVVDIDDFDNIALSFEVLENQIEDFRSLHDKIETHYEYVKQLEANSNTAAAAIETTLRQVASYIEENAVYIDDATEKVLFDLVPESERLFDELETERPDYASLAARLSALKQTVDAGVQQAHDEHEEILGLERYIDEAIETHQQEWSKLNVYEQTHADVDTTTENDIRNARDDVESIEARPLVATAENRRALREQKMYLQEAIDRLKELHSDAKSDVAREERIREEAREALRRAEEAKRQAERARQRAAEERERSRTRMSTSYSSGSSSRSFSSGSSARSHSSGSSRRG